MASFWQPGSAEQAQSQGLFSDSILAAAARHRKIMIDGQYSGTRNVRDLTRVSTLLPTILTRRKPFGATRCNQQYRLETRQGHCKASNREGQTAKRAVSAAETSTVLWLLSQLPANAAESSVDFSKGSFSTQSYVVTLGLFLISLPGNI